MRAELFSLSWENIPEEILECQRLAINALGYRINQHRFDGLRHGEWMDQVLRELSNVDVFLFVDADAVPLHKSAIDYAILTALEGKIFGCAQSANHIESRRGHIYAGPFFMAVSRRTWEELGMPSCMHASDRDVGQGLTLTAEERGREVELWYPTSVDEPKWPLGNSGMQFGIGTIYNNSVFHLFESRSGQNQRRFAEVCLTVMEQALKRSNSNQVTLAPGGVPKFSSDWLSRHIPVWNELFGHLRNYPAQILEIGSFEGRSTLWFCENIATHPDSRITCIDLFNGDGTKLYDSSLQRSSLKERFLSNTRNYSDKIRMIHGASGEVVRTLGRTETFDAIYIDGSHKSWHVLEDAVLGFPLLKTGGIMLFDDYEGGDIASLEYPHQAVNAFMSIHKNSLEVVHRGYQLALMKTSSETC